MHYSIYPDKHTTFIYLNYFCLAAAKRPVIQAAAQFWEDNTCLDFELTTTDYTNGLYFINGPGCYSYIGKIGGMQPVSIGDGCQYVRNFKNIK